MEQKSAAYHRAAAARAEATTRSLQAQLEDTIAQQEQIVEEIERASGPSADDVDRGSEKL